MKYNFMKVWRKCSKEESSHFKLPGKNPKLVMKKYNKDVHKNALFFREELLSFDPFDTFEGMFKQAVVPLVNRDGRAVIDHSDIPYCTSRFVLVEDREGKIRVNDIYRLNKTTSSKMLSEFVDELLSTLYEGETSDEDMKVIREKCDVFFNRFNLCLASVRHTPGKNKQNQEKQAIEEVANV